MELLFLLIGIGGTYLYYRKKVKTRIQLDTEIEKKNEQLRYENLGLEEECSQLTQEIEARQAEVGLLRSDKKTLEQEKVLLKESIDDYLDTINDNI